MKESEMPIGIFDSGIGGMTVAHAIRELMPGESLVYFGDTAHLPYGDKSEAAIQAYSIKIADILLEKNCKVIVIACNSASSSAYELLREYVGSKTRVINVIDPMIEHVGANFSGRKVGLIGTRRTIESGVYASKLNSLNPDVELISMATPLLVPMIEEGFLHNRISTDIISAYLGDAVFDGIEGLILGCTHYPLIMKSLGEFLGEGVEILDSSQITAQHVQDLLTSQELLCEHCGGDDEFFVSDYTSSFEASTRMFFGEKVRLTNYRLWE
ncbi:MAG: glutamate racemase [Cyclobacteriaceae bacterium]